MTHNTKLEQEIMSFELQRQIINKLMELDCRKYLPFPEAQGEFHHGYYQAIRDAIDVIYSFDRPSKKRLLHSIIETNKGDWCQSCQDFAENCKATKKEQL